jgi:hypothetical protein
MIHPSLRDDEGCVGCPCRGSEIRGRGPLVGRWSSQPYFCRVAATEFCRGFQPTDHVAPIGSRRVATDECHPSGIHAGRTPALPGVPVAIPFTSQGLYSTVADATGGWGSPMIRGLKPTAKINRRYATMGIPPTMGGCPDAMMRILGYLRRGAETHWDVGRKPVAVGRWL